MGLPENRRTHLKITLYLSDKPREYAIGDALAAGFRKHGDIVDVIATQDFVRPDWETQLAVIIGIKAHSKRIMEEYRRGGRHCMLVDKSYFGRTEYVRLSVDGFQPAYAHAKPRPADRWQKIADEFRIELQPRRAAGGDYLIYAGSSQKYCDWHELGDVSEFATSTCHAINKQTHSDIKLLYRPKPSWVAGHAADVRLVPETEFSGPDVKLGKLLPDCAALITHGSNAAVEAIIGGVPVIVLSRGACAAESVAGKKIEALRFVRIGDFSPEFPTDAQRIQWLADLAYCQFNVEELTNGTAWEIIAPNTMKAGLQTWAGLPDAECVIAQYRAMHESAKMMRGGSIKGHIEAIQDLVAKHKPASLIDYGCGKGAQYTEWNLQAAWGGITPARYDPGVPGIDTKPAEKFDGVICTDVMEHVPPDSVDAVFAEAIGYGAKFAFFCIYTEPSRKFLPDGRNCHLTCRPESWWIERACALTGGTVADTYDIAKPIPGGGYETFKHWSIRAESGAEVVLTFRGGD